MPLDKNDKIFYPGRYQSKLDIKYGKQKSLNQALGRFENRRCAIIECKKWFTVSTSKIGVDRAFCPKHREEFHQKEAEEMIMTQAIDEALQTLETEKYNDEISTKEY